MDTENGTALRVLLGVALSALILGGVVDLVLDAPSSWLTFHVVFELLMIAGGLVIAIAFWMGWWRAERSLDEVRTALERRREERDAWRDSAQRALEGLGRAIDDQFAAWGLTPAEREVALHVMKGLSHKHIARVTGRSERTVRQHAASAYRKAGLSSRAELAAFFLEDLMLPADPASLSNGGRGATLRPEGE